MRRSNLATLLYLLLVFASGIVVGGFANRLYMMRSVNAASTPKSHSDFREKYIKEMRTRLKLSEPQVTELQKILETTDHSLREMHKSIDAEHAQKVIAMLNDTQKTEYAKIREEREQRRREREQKGQ